MESAIRGQSWADQVVRATAPARVDLTGGFTDCPPFVDEAGSRMVNAAIEMRAVATVSLAPVAPARMMHLNSRSTGGPVIASAGWLASRLGIDAARIAATEVSTAAPAGAGLGTSAAQGVAIGAALAAAAGRPAEAGNLAELAAAAERATGVPGGRQDQYAAVYGGVHLWQFGDGSAGGVNRTPLAAAWWPGRLLLVHPGGTRNSGDLVTAVAERFAAGNRTTIAALHRLNALAGDIAAAVTANDPDVLGAALNEVRVTQRAACSALVDDHIEDRLMSTSGVVAAKPCGGAGPGSAWLVMASADSDAVAARIRATGLSLLPLTLARTGVLVAESTTPGHPQAAP